MFLDGDSQVRLNLSCVSVEVDGCSFCDRQPRMMRAQLQSDDACLIHSLHAPPTLVRKRMCGRAVLDFKAVVSFFVV